MRSKGILNAFWLKLIMAVLMLLDHVYYFLPGQPIWMNMAGRVVAPVFAFLVAEGLYYTRDRKRYTDRMLWFGVAMLCGNIVFQIIFKDAISNSILISLAISAKLVDRIEGLCFGTIKKVNFIYIPFFLLLSMLFEGMWLCPVMILIFYFLRRKVIFMLGIYAVVIVPVTVMTGMGPSYQWMMILAIIPILLYNGKRGPNNTTAKYFFYFFYPLHIWTLYLIGHLGG